MPRQFWKNQHIGKKVIDLRVGCLDRNNFNFRSYSSLSPNLVLLGAQKCGTTSLAHYLSRHPDIHASMPLKEPGFYIYEEWAKAYWKNLGRTYKNSNELLRKGMLQGYSGQKYFLDATTCYTLGDSAKDFNIPSKLASAVEKCLYIVRNPFSRMCSSYNSFYKGRVNEGFNERFAVDSSILKTSLYFEQLASYTMVLGSENILVIVFEEFIKDIPGSLRRIYDFLNLECILPYSEFPVLNRTKNRTEHLYSLKNFQELSTRITEDVKNLEALLGRSINWDLSSSRWVRPQ